MTKYLQLKSLHLIGSSPILISTVAILFFLALIIPLTKVNSATNIPLCEITRSLKVGSSGEDVRCLQRYLNWAGYTLSATGPGSPGSESVYFGPLTANAVIKWQNANATQVLSPAGLTIGTGYFGPMSFSWYVNIVRTQFGLAT